MSHHLSRNLRFADVFTYFPTKPVTTDSSVKPIAIIALLAYSIYLCNYSEIYLKRNLQRTEYRLWPQNFTVPSTLCKKRRNTAFSERQLPNAATESKDSTLTEIHVPRKRATIPFTVKYRKTYVFLITCSHGLQKEASA
jgi:hypothetical protein